MKRRGSSGWKYVVLALCILAGAAGLIVLAMRWNGTDDNVIGNPQSRGLPTWFIVPREFRLAVLDELSAWFLRRLYWHVSSSLTPWH